MKRALLLFKAIIVLGFLMLVTGCATNRGMIDVRVVPTPDPQSSAVVKIVRVTDQRVFELRPTVASTPSLKDGQINNKAITSRAIARKRNGFGKALGDILLPEGRSVEDLVKESVQKALRDKGYSVATDDSQVDVIPVEVDINQFWAWMTPGVWSIGLEFEAEVDITSPLMSSSNKETVRGYVKLHSQMATGKAWLNTVNKGLADLITNIKGKIRNP